MLVQLKRWSRLVKLMIQLYWINWKLKDFTLIPSRRRSGIYRLRTRLLIHKVSSVLRH